MILGLASGSCRSGSSLIAAAYPVRRCTLWAVKITTEHRLVWNSPVKWRATRSQLASVFVGWVLDYESSTTVYTVDSSSPSRRSDNQQASEMCLEYQIIFSCRDYGVAMLRTMEHQPMLCESECLLTPCGGNIQIDLPPLRDEFVRCELCELKHSDRYIFMAGKGLSCDPGVAKMVHEGPTMTDFQVSSHWAVTCPSAMFRPASVTDPCDREWRESIHKHGCQVLQR